jgi:hypothetical protein
MLKEAKPRCFYRYSGEADRANRIPKPLLTRSRSLGGRRTLKSISLKRFPQRRRSTKTLTETMNCARSWEWCACPERIL